MLCIGRVGEMMGKNQCQGLLGGGRKRERQLRLVLT